MASLLVDKLTKLSKTHVVPAFREFDALVKAIGECKSKAEEDRIMVQEVETLKQRLTDPRLDRARGREYMVRVLYCEMLGHDVSFALIPCLQLASDPNLLTKKAAYLTLTQLLDRRHDLVLLLVNTLLGDMRSDNFVVAAAALTAATRLVGPDLIGAVLPVVLEKLSHPKDAVRKKAVAALHCFLRLDPRRTGALQGCDVSGSLRAALCDRDPGVMSAALSAIDDAARLACALAGPLANSEAAAAAAAAGGGGVSGSAAGALSPPTSAAALSAASFLAELRALVPPLCSILQQCLEGRLPRGHDYHRVPAPFVQIKLLRALGRLGKGDRASSEAMAGVVGAAIRRAAAAAAQAAAQAAGGGGNNHQQLPAVGGAHATAAHAVAVEGVRAAAACAHRDPQLLQAAADAVAPLLRPGAPPNLRAAGLAALGRLAAAAPQYAREHQLAVVDCLEDPDDSLRLRALALLAAVTRAANAEVVVERLLLHCRAGAGGGGGGATANGAAAADAHVRRELVRRAAALAGRYAPSGKWYVSTMAALLEVAGARDAEGGLGGEEEEEEGAEEGKGSGGAAGEGEAGEGADAAAAAAEAADATSGSVHPSLVHALVRRVAESDDPALHTAAVATFLEALGQYSGGQDEAAAGAPAPAASAVGSLLPLGAEPAPAAAPATPSSPSRPRRRRRHRPRGPPPEGLLRAACWVLGEYGHLAAAPGFSAAMAEAAAAAAATAAATGGLPAAVQAGGDDHDGSASPRAATAAYRPSPVVTTVQGVIARLVQAASGGGGGGGGSTAGSTGGAGAGLLLSPATRGYLVTAVGKLAARLATSGQAVPSEARELLRSAARAQDPDVQQRALEAAALVELLLLRQGAGSSAPVARAALGTRDQVPAAELARLREGMPWLDAWVARREAAMGGGGGGGAYRPPAWMTGAGSGGGSGAMGLVSPGGGGGGGAAAHHESALRFGAYERQEAPSASAAAPAVAAPAPAVAPAAPSVGLLPGMGDDFLPPPVPAAAAAAAAHPAPQQQQHQPALLLRGAASGAARWGPAAFAPPPPPTTTASVAAPAPAAAPAAAAPAQPRAPPSPAASGPPTSRDLLAAALFGGGGGGGGRAAAAAAAAAPAAPPLAPAVAAPAAPAAPAAMDDLLGGLMLDDNGGGMPTPAPVAAAAPTPADDLLGGLGLGSPVPAAPAAPAAPTPAAAPGAAAPMRAGGAPGPQQQAPRDPFGDLLG